MMAEVHDMPWVMASDFNEPLMEGINLEEGG